MNRNITRIVAIAATLAMGTSLAACGGSSADSSKGHVYFMNNKAEVVDQYKELASMYTKKTGVQVDIQTGAAGTYDATMKSELAKDNAPTMFNVAGFDQFAKYQKYVEPLQDTDVFKLLNDTGKAYSYTIDGNSYTLPYAAEWYGIIYNKKIIKDYCAKSYAVIKSADDIKDYKTLKQVAESIEQHKDDLGVDGAFATPGLDTSDTYRFAAHMTRLPLYYEYRDANTTFSKTIKGTYLKNYKDMFDLQLKTSPTEASMVSSKTYDDVTSEFALGQVAFYPNGVWAYSQIKGNDVADEDLGMLPYYMGIKGEEESGPAGVYDASWAVNKNASDKDKQATLDFIKWMVTDDEAKKILAVAGAQASNGFESLKSIIMRTFEHINVLYESKGGITGLATGFKDLDRLTSGLQASDLILVAARPSMGKTAFTLNIASYVGLHGGKVAFFSLEMSKEQLMQRMLCSEGDIDSQMLRTGQLDDEDWSHLVTVADKLNRAPIYIDDTAGITVMDLRSKARRLKAEHGLDLIVIDYLQLMQGRPSKNGDNRQQEISEISRSLKALARELNVPVIALSQLSRSVEARQVKRPMLSDLRESGSLEQDADIVMFLYREDYYDKDTDKKNQTEVIIAKHRNGPVDTVRLYFQKEYTKFRDMIQE